MNISLEKHIIRLYGNLHDYGKYLYTNMNLGYSSIEYPIHTNSDLWISKCNFYYKKINNPILKLNYGISFIPYEYVLHTTFILHFNDSQIEMRINATLDISEKDFNDFPYHSILSWYLCKGIILESFFYREPDFYLRDEIQNEWDNIHPFKGVTLPKPKKCEQREAYLINNIDEIKC